MERSVAFRTSTGVPVPAVTAGQMREIDRIAVDDFGLSILQMMENAGRSLALSVMDMLGPDDARQGSPPTEQEKPDRSAGVVVLAGSGGNGGGGLCCARHLHNRGFRVRVVLSREPEELGAAAANQLRILRGAGVEPLPWGRAHEELRQSRLVVDALIGYSLRGAPRGRVAELIDFCNEQASPAISLDLPSGLDATTGEAPGVWVQSERILTLALPKTGLRRVPGELFLADIGIPPEVYDAVGLRFRWPSLERYWIKLRS